MGHSLSAAEREAVILTVARACNSPAEWAIHDRRPSGSAIVVEEKGEGVSQGFLASPPFTIQYWSPPSPRGPRPGTFFRSGHLFEVERTGGRLSSLVSPLPSYHTTLVTPPPSGPAIEDEGGGGGRTGFFASPLPS